LRIAGTKSSLRRSNPASISNAYVDQSLMQGTRMLLFDLERCTALRRMRARLRRFT